MHWNARSVKNKMVQLYNTINTEKPIVITICETWLNKKDTFKINGYKIFRKDRSGKTGGGLIIAVDQSLQVKQLEMRTDITDELESLGIKIKLKNGWSSIITIYNPCRPIKTQEYEKLFRQCSNTTLLTGDFNAKNSAWDLDILPGGGNKAGENLVTALITSDMLLLTPPGLKTYTCPKTGKEGTLDLILGNGVYSDGVISTGPYMGSDHLPVMIELGNPPEFTQEIKAPRWKITEAKLHIFTDKSKNITVKGSTNTADKVKEFTNNMNETAGSAFKKTSGLPPRKQLNTWWDENCETATYEKNQAYYRWQKRPTPENKINFKQKEAKSRKVILEAKRGAWDSFCRKIDFRTAPKTAWRLIANLNGKHSKPRENIHEPDTFMESQLSKPNYTVLPPNYEESFDLYKKETELWINQPFNMKEMNKAIDQLPMKKTPGPDEIPNELIKALADEPRKVLLDLINECWVKGIFPEEWKLAHKIPILKPGKEAKLPESYRLISLLNTLAKLFERLVTNRLIWFCEDSGKFGAHINGFRPHKSTRDILCYIDSTAREATKDKKVTLITFLDLEAAFDKASHRAVMKKAVKIGLRGRILSWIENYLDNRKVQIRIGNNKSTKYCERDGVPQGAIISPVLFNILTHDIPKVRSCKILSYADDITLITVADNIHEAAKNTNTALRELEQWTNDSGQKPNSTKSAVLVITNQRNKDRPPILINNVQIQYTKEHRLLGIILDGPKLTYGKHIDHLSETCVKRLDIMKKVSGTKWGAGKLSLTMIYNAMIKSKMLYCCELFRNASNTNVKKLEIIQNTAMRLITGAMRTSPINALYVETRLLPITKMINLRSILLYGRLKFSPKDSLGYNIFNQRLYSSQTVEIIEKYHLPAQKWTQLNRQKTSYTLLGEDIDIRLNIDPYYIKSKDDKIGLRIFLSW